MTEMSNETYLLKQFNAMFRRYCDTWKGKTRRRITVEIIYIDNEHAVTVVDALVALGFTQSERNPRRFTKWEAK